MRLILCVCTLFLISGCEPKESNRSDEKTPTVPQVELTQYQAISIATKYLEQQEWKDQYDASKPARLVESPEYWNIFFARVNFSGKPREGLIRVDKQTKEPNWIPLK